MAGLDARFEEVRLVVCGGFVWWELVSGESVLVRERREDLYLDCECYL